jgi:ribose-phosphate pyrophosphokinase
MNKIILSGENSLSISLEVSEIKKILMIKKCVRKFPDGETYLRLEKTNFNGKNVYLIHSLAPEQNESLIELFLSIDTIRDYGAKKIHLITPYLAYARQHKRYLSGEAFSLKTFIKILKFLGTSRMTTIDAHFCRKVGVFNLFGLKIENLTAAPLIFDYIKKEIGNDSVLVGLDAGSKNFLSNINSRKIFLKKEKFCPRCGLKATKCVCKMKEKEYEIKIKGIEKIKGKNVIILDDIIASGKTMIEGVRAMKGIAKSICIGCTHGLFLGDSLKILRENCDLVVSTNTIKSDVSKVSVAPLIIKVIR